MSTPMFIGIRRPLGHWPCRPALIFTTEREGVGAHFHPQTSSVPRFTQTDTGRHRCIHDSDTDAESR
eukprot:7154015-Lingulodinium_polyedra.AAC.1